MPVVEASIVIRAPQDSLFALAQDYGLRLQWDPFLREMQFLDGATEAAPGGRVRVRSRRGLMMTVEYTTLQPPERVAVKMVEGPFFFARFGGAWLFTATDADNVDVRFRYNFQTRCTLLRPVLDPIIRFVFHRDIQARLHRLKWAAEETEMLQQLQPAITDGLDR